MARYTEPYRNLILGLAEVDALRKIATKLEAVDAFGHRNYINSICRGAVVLLSSHLEGYVKGLGEVILERFQTRLVCRSKIPARTFYYLSQDAIRDIKETSDPEKLAGRMFSFLQRDLSHWSRSGPFPGALNADTFSSGFPSPKFNHIKKYFKRLGLDEYEGKLASIQKANHIIIITSINHLVDTRNKIAHGDIGTMKIPHEIRIFLDNLRTFCINTDGVIGDICKIKYCTIR